MAKEDRDNLARNVQKLLRATYASPDPDGLMGKLRSALDGLVALADEKNPQGGDQGILGVKRSLVEVDEDADAEGKTDWNWMRVMRYLRCLRRLCSRWFL